jgi:hypothetical protein
MRWQVLLLRIVIPCAIAADLIFWLVVAIALTTGRGGQVSRPPAMMSLVERRSASSLGFPDCPSIRSGNSSGDIFLAFSAAHDRLVAIHIPARAAHRSFATAALSIVGVAVSFLLVEAVNFVVGFPQSLFVLAPVPLVAHWPATIGRGDR